MSARVLILGPHMLHLQCHERMAREDGEEATLGGFQFNVGKWTVGISDYTHRLLTFPSDRLAAVSGVAKALKQEMEIDGVVPQYLAGLWNAEEFPGQLLWSINDPKENFEKVVAQLTDDEGIYSTFMELGFEEMKDTCNALYMPRRKK